MSEVPLYISTERESSTICREGRGVNKTGVDTQSGFPGFPPGAIHIYIYIYIYIYIHITYIYRKVDMLPQLHPLSRRDPDPVSVG